MSGHLYTLSIGDIQPNPGQPSPSLTAVEEAEAAGRLDKWGHLRELRSNAQGVPIYPDQEQLAGILGKRSTVAEILSLNRLPAEIRDECR